MVRGPAARKPAPPPESFPNRRAIKPPTEPHSTTVGPQAISAGPSSGHGGLKTRGQADPAPAPPVATAPSPLAIFVESATVGFQEDRRSQESVPAIQNKESTVTWADILKTKKPIISATAAPCTNQAREVVPFSPTNSFNQIILVDSSASKDATLIQDTDEKIQIESEIISLDTEKYYFFGQEGYDSIKIGSKFFKFAVKNSEVVIFEFKKTQLDKVNFELYLAPQIIRFLSQFTSSGMLAYKEKRRVGDITVSLEINRSGYYVKIAKNKGSSIQIPLGPQNSNLSQFITIFSNFTGFPRQAEPISLQQSSYTNTDEAISISKLIFNFQTQSACADTQRVYSPRKQLKMSLTPAYSDASDSFDHSDDSFFSDDFLGHATESDRRPPISNEEDIRNSKFNSVICRKAEFITLDNCLPTDNLNTQLKIYKKAQKNKRRHSMRTRSQSKNFPWD